MSRIHPTAIIDPQARLAPDVVVGPGCIIDGPVQLGEGTRLMAHVFLQGPLSIGRNNTIYPHACLGYSPQDRKYALDDPGPGVVIGHGNTFREGCTIHRATKDKPTTIGDDNYLMVNSHVGHDSVMGDHCTMTNGSVLGGHVQLGDNVTLGGNAGVHQFCRVGRLAMISGNEGISRDLPPFCVCYHTRRVGSLNLVGLRRAGLRQHIDPLKQAFNIFFRKQHSNTRALRLIDEQLGDDPLCREFAQFIRQTRRGITTYATSRTSHAE